ITLPCLPAVFVEMASVEVDNIKRKSNRARKFLTLIFLKLRPIKLTVWRLFHLNISFCIYLLGICTSYVIAITQFTEL
ncbi:uncharacterized protein LOC126776615, partial [Nymphalis io]|uniref:uncharacterized protein LOC126776615 n=1 Tax=Inachis io TaxID=171585 RepID=UPI0021696483